MHEMAYRQIRSLVCGREAPHTIRIMNNVHFSIDDDNCDGVRIVHRKINVRQCRAAGNNARRTKSAFSHSEIDAAVCQVEFRCADHRQAAAASTLALSHDIYFIAKHFSGHK